MTLSLPHVLLRITGLLVLACVFTTASAAAQVTSRVQATATVTKAAPVFLLPDASRQPLRTLAVGTTLTIMQVRGDWLEVTFLDPQFGRRTGWVQRDFVRINTGAPPEQEPAPAKPAPGAPPPRPAPTTTARPARTTATNQIGVRAFGTIAFDKMAASESFKAVTESDTTTLFGGGVQATNLWRGLFAEVGVEVTSLDGERVFVGPNDEIFRLGIPIEIKMRRVDVVGGWRTTVDRFTTYAAAGPTFLKYEETSDFADPGENVDQSNTGFVLLGGGEVSVTRWVHIRGEVRYRRIKDAIGVGGVSAHFDETDLGGFGAALKIAVGR